MPNFHKYGFHEGFEDGIRFITEDYILNKNDDGLFWHKQEVAQHFDSEKDRMWGITAESTCDTITYNGRTLRAKYTQPELWLRSDLVRLEKIFNVATPDKCDLEFIQKRYNKLQWKNN